MVILADQVILLGYLVKMLVHFFFKMVSFLIVIYKNVKGKWLKVVYPKCIVNIRLKVVSQAYYFSMLLTQNQSYNKQ